MRVAFAPLAFAALALSAAGASFSQQGTPPGPRVGRDFTPGWAMMSPQERDDFHQRLRAATTRAECRKLMDEHRKMMDDRARDRRMTMHRPRHDPCSAWPG